MMKVEYLPGPENGIANARLREERPWRLASKDPENPDCCLASGHVVGAPPHIMKDSVGVATPT